MSGEKETVQPVTKRAIADCAFGSRAPKRTTRIHQQDTETIERTEDTQASAVKPRFIRHDLTGPDGKTRQGWEMWLGERCFGRADDKQLLLTSLDRIQNPLRSHHWRERQFGGRSSQQ